MLIREKFSVMDAELCMNSSSLYAWQVVSASGAVKHEDVVEQVKKVFTKLSANPATTSQLVASDPVNFTGSEVCSCCLLAFNVLSLHMMTFYLFYLLIFSAMNLGEDD